MNFRDRLGCYINSTGSHTVNSEHHSLLSTALPLQTLGSFFIIQSINITTMANQNPNPNYTQQTQWASNPAPTSSPSSQSSGTTAPPNYSFAQPRTPQFPPAFQHQQQHQQHQQQEQSPSQYQTQFHHYQPNPAQQPAPATRYPITAPFQVPRMHAWPTPGGQSQGQGTPIDPELLGGGNGRGSHSSQWPPTSRS
ncbi:hypothetical protein B0J11DRAFT_208264 [Dendryphion nanum]|uniref:Uncharacterized protein n=1 Tax=Dendryphion nanum TaxID=256645 RepID=A0A9P9CYP0_9PLEO|nr:hypothetical protein B0J11DRAFT_208264 [Dendryphion nanum]